MNHKGEPADTNRLLWTMAALVATAAPHLAHLPLWPMGLMTVTVGWRLAVQFRGLPLPGFVIRMLLAIAGFAGVLLTYKTINGLDAGSTLLVVMASLKLTETRHIRDLIVLLMISFFLVVTQFLFGQSILGAVYAVPAIWLVTTAMLQVSSRADNALPWREAFSRSGVLLAQATPLMLIAFLLFPRLSGPFWAMPRTDSSAMTGLSNEMAPGSITQLLQSDAVAFRVSFDDASPPPELRYWRGPVLSNFDGRRWSVFQERDRALAPRSIENLGPPLGYTITLEPHQQEWLLALEQPDPGSLPRSSYLSNDLRLLRNRPVSRLYRYHLQSWPQHIVNQQAKEWELRRDLQYPQLRNPRAQALAQTWADQASRPDEVVNEALRLFREQPFHYTLSPPRLGTTNPVDEFLYEGRRGFCEHYASAFTLLMRAAGIPARVVLGYQGGEVNPYTGHMTVRQSDAHAWSEVWLIGRGWVRVDPTAAVAPERVELGMAGSLPEGESLPGLFRAYAWLRQMQLGWDAVNNGWNQWVLGFSREKQRELLKALGMKNPGLRTMLLTMIGLMTAVLSLLALYLLWQNRPARNDPVVRAYRRFCAKTKPVSGPRGSTEGPLDYADRVCAERPALGPAIRRVTGLYLDLRYHGATEADLAGFRRAIRGLRV